MSIGAPQISVIVPCRDDEEHLHDALHSIIQTSIALEIIIVDDGSDPAIAVPNDDRLVLIRVELPGGPAAARNLGIEAARGEIIAFCDSDDLLLPGRLERALELHRQADVVVVGQGKTDSRSTENHVPRSLSEALDRTNPHLGATSIRREIAPMMNPAYLGAQDIEWWIKVMEQKPTFAATPEVLYLHRPSDRPRVLNSQSARLRFSYQLFDDHADFFKRHRRAAAYRWYRIMQMERQAGERARARRALVKSLRAYPTLRALKCVPALTLPRSGRGPS